MEKLQILYILLAAVGAFVLVLSIFGGEADAEIDIGGDFDISDAESPSDSVSVFSLRTLATFMLGFGMAGWSVMKGDGGITAQILAGFGAGLVISFLYYLVMRFFFSMQGSSMPTAKAIMGKQGIVAIPTTSTGVAQIKVKTVTGYSDYTCKEVNGKKLAQNDIVKITSVENGMAVIIVEKI